MHQLARRNLLLHGIVLAAAGFFTYYALKASQWVVMTDELQTSKLAQSIAETGSPLPRIHGHAYGSYNQLYPLLTAPFYALLDVPTAFRAIHVANALLMASSAWPAFLLARGVTQSRLAALLVAALSVAVPWTVLTTTMLTEVVAYPIFLWSIVLATRAIAAPSPRRDLLALAGLALAYLARTQLLVLALLLPLAVLVHEGALAARRGDGPLVRVLGAFRRALRAHATLAAAYVAVAAALASLAATGSSQRVLGNYAEAAGGGLLPPGVWRAAAQHLDLVVVAVGVAPFLLALAWAVGELARSQAGQSHAFAALLVLVVPLLTLEVASFDLRFTPGAFAQDRYLFYLAPLLFVGAAAFLCRRVGILELAALAAGAGFFAWIAGFAAYRPGVVIYWASPAAAFHGALARAAGWLGAEPLALVRWGGLLAVAVAVAARAAAAAPRALLGVGLPLLGFCLFETGYVFERSALPVITRPLAIGPVQKDWIDAALPDGASAAVLANPGLPPNPWWDTEFWNEAVDRAYRYGEGTTYTPFPADELRLDFGTGAIDVAAPRRFLVLAESEARLGFRGAFPLSFAGGLQVVGVPVPYRAMWATQGSTPDGWTQPGTPVRLRLFALHGEPRRWRVAVTLRAPATDLPAVGYRLVAPGVRVAAALAPGAVRTEKPLPVCVPGSGHADVVVTSRDVSQLEDGRVVGVRIEGISATIGGRC